MHESVEAAGALGRAAGMEKAARARSGWYARYLWVYAAGQLVLVPLAVLGRGPVAVALMGAINVLLVSGLSLYAARQRVVRRGFGAKHGVLIGSWAAVFALSVVSGVTVFGRSVPFAAAAALACALPLALGAWSETRGASSGMRGAA
ncbi:hypothetical protein ACFCYI_29310 [Streptomyces sp. NPDC056257]|uniref:hypothetical protein n=1 Tax=unclassified Streptomyces TaxID=2593676 RepID=UPI0035E34AEE